jgi:hypothetical protein
VKRRSAARSSADCPRARSLANGSGGSLRLATTRPERAGQVFQEEFHGPVHVLRVDQVVVVHHQDHVLRRLGQVVDQRRDGRHERRRRRVTDQEARAFGHTGPSPVHGCGDVPPEPHGIVVTLVQREPGDGPPVDLHPVGEQRRLPEPGGRADQHELACGRRPQPLQEAGAGYPTLA